LPGGRCHDEGKDKLRKGDKPSSHFGRRLSDEMVLCQLAQAAEKDSYASLRSIDFASTYKSTPPLIDLHAPRL
jgi:hypothetical protein